MNYFEKRRPEKQANHKPASSNVWLVAGDETGRFEKNTDTGFHGVALVLARTGDWHGIVNEELAGQKVQDRFKRPVEGLAEHLGALYPDAARREKECQKHHVLAAFDYFRWKTELTGGSFDLESTPSDPVLRHLLESMRWLAGHPRLLCVGVYGNGGDLYKRLYRGDDSMAALGALYGRLLAAIYPFLGNKPCVRLLSGGRSETPDSPGVSRVGVALPGSIRQPSRQTGGDRVNISFLQDSFWESMSALQEDTGLPDGVLQRQQTLSVHSVPREFNDQLRHEALNAPDTEIMKNLADLACGMMASLEDNVRDKKIRFNLGRQPGKNMRFFNIQDILA